MVVLTQNRKAGVVGLHIGAGNVERYFPRSVLMVELQLDHLCIVCTLEPSFWLDRPEIHDLRLSLWLESKRNSGKISSKSAPVALIPSGLHAFRIQLTVEEQVVELAEPISFVTPMVMSGPAAPAGMMNGARAIDPSRMADTSRVADPLRMVAAASRGYSGPDSRYGQGAAATDEIPGAPVGQVERRARRRPAAHELGRLNGNDRANEYSIPAAITSAIH